MRLMEYKCVKILALTTSWVSRKYNLNDPIFCFRVYIYVFSYKHMTSTQQILDDVQIHNVKKNEKELFILICIYMLKNALLYYT